MSEWAQLRGAGTVLSAHQEREQVVSRHVVADQLRRDALGLQEHVDSGCIVTLLGVRATEIETDLAPTTRQAGGRCWRSMVSPVSTAMSASPNATAAETR